MELSDYQNIIEKVQARIAELQKELSLLKGLKPDKAYNLLIVTSPEHALTTIKEFEEVILGYEKLISEYRNRNIEREFMVVAEKLGF